MPSQSSFANPDDAVRDAILRHLYDIHRKARGPKSAAVGVRALQQALKEANGFKAQQVASNLDYLVQKQWVREVVKSQTYVTKGGTARSAEQTKYKISDMGIDKLEKASLFQRTTANAGINITNIHGVTVIGDGNVVNTNFTDLSRVMTEMKTAIQTHAGLSDDEKLATAADIDALQAQLQKPTPNKTVVTSLWRSIEVAVTAAGFAELLHQAAQLIAPLLN
jgi:hypothetical protein